MSMLFSKKLSPPFPVETYFGSDGSTKGDYLHLWAEFYFFQAKMDSEIMMARISTTPRTEFSSILFDKGDRAPLFSL